MGGYITDSDVLGEYDCPYKSTMILPKEATIFIINFVVTWKPGLNDLTLHVTFNILQVSDHAIL